MSDQQLLFELEPHATTQPCREIDTVDVENSSQLTDTAARHLVSLSKRVLRTADPIERARAAADVRNLAEVIVAASIRQANDAGSTWRELGDRLAVPFPTLYRRYGGG